MNWAFFNWIVERLCKAYVFLNAYSISHSISFSLSNIRSRKLFNEFCMASFWKRIWYSVCIYIFAYSCFLRATSKIERCSWKGKKTWEHRTLKHRNTIQYSFIGILGHLYALIRWAYLRKRIYIHTELHSIWLNLPAMVISLHSVILDINGWANEMHTNRNIEMYNKSVNAVIDSVCNRAMNQNSDNQCSVKI